MNSTEHLNDTSPSLAVEPGPRRAAGPVGLWGFAGKNVRGLLRDERGQVTLLAAMMSFLIAIFVAIGVYTNIAIHRRITIQNAVDSAAEAAALWQARGCNIIQGLNNLHYDINVLAGVGESAAAAGCVASFLPFPGAKQIGCTLCASGPVIDAAQQQASAFILGAQSVVVDTTPILAFLAANACARGGGAERVLNAVPAAVAEWINAVDSGLSQTIDTSLGLGALGDFMGALANNPVAGSIPVYAAPMDTRFFDLGVYRKRGTKFPWTYPKEVGDYVIEPIGVTWCRSEYSSGERIASSLKWDGKWGWKDSFYFGHPGYSTWVAGMGSAKDVLGMSKMAWMSGNRKDLEDIDTMYVDRIDGNPLTVPAVLGIASSQIEGTPVVDKGKTDAKGKLIKVYLPNRLARRGYIEGESLGILH